MTKEITKAVILQEIQDKFKLREFASAKFLFDETVVPVYEIRGHLQSWRSRHAQLSVTAAGSFSFFTVPTTERWTLRSYSVIFMTGVYTVAGIYILRNLRGGSTDFSYLDLEAAQSTSYLTALPAPTVLEPGDDLRVNVDGYTSTGNLQLHIDYMKEEIR